MDMVLKGKNHKRDPKEENYIYRWGLIIGLLTVIAFILGMIAIASI